MWLPLNDSNSTRSNMKNIDFSNNEREVPSKENIGALRAALIHEEEIENHIQKNKLSPGLAALYIWSMGSQGQKVGMLTRLKDTQCDMDEKSFTTLLGEFNDSMWSQGVEVQTTIPYVMSDLINRMTEYQLHLVFQGCEMMLSVSSIEVREVWGTLALDLVGVLSPELCEKDMITFALRKTDHSEREDQRVFSTRLIGALCKKLSADRVVEKILPKTLSLCQDTDIKVRVAMCNVLVEVVKVVGVKIAKDRITSELFELLDDEEKLVAKAAFSCLIDFIYYFDAPYRKQYFYPIIRNYLKSPPPSIHIILAEEFGRLLEIIQTDISSGSSDDVSLFTSFFMQTAQKPDPDLRRSAAYNLPAVLLCLPSTSQSPLFFTVIRDLSGDPNPSVRISMAAGMLEVMKLLDDRAAQFYKDPFSLLILDSSMDVRHHLMNNLQDILNIFVDQLMGESKDDFFNDTVVNGIISYLQFYENKNWRKVKIVFDVIHTFSDSFSRSILHDKLIPVALRYIKNGVTVLRQQCAVIIAMLMSKLKNNNLIAEAYTRIISDLSRSSSCYHRIAHLYVFRETAHYFSKKFVWELLESVVALHKDPVMSVRLEVAKSLTTWHKCLIGCQDASLLNGFTSTLEALQMDSDVLVRQAAQAYIDGVNDVDWTTSSAEKLRSLEIEAMEGNLVEIIKDIKNSERRNKLKELIRESELDGNIYTGHGHGSGNSLKTINPNGKGICHPKRLPQTHTGAVKGVSSSRGPLHTPSTSSTTTTTSNSSAFHLPKMSLRGPNKTTKTSSRSPAVIGKR